MARAMRARGARAQKRGRGRPLTAVANRPACPAGHPGRVLLHGRREWAETPFRRQRAVCIPGNGLPRHTFSINRRQAHGSHPHGETCPTCDVKPGIAQGPIALADFFHTANEIGQLLALIGRDLRRTARSQAGESTAIPPGGTLRPVGTRGLAHSPKYALA